MTTKINIEFEIEITHEQCDEMILGYIPDIDYYFSASTFEEFNSKAKSIIKSYIKRHNKQNEMV